MFENIGRKIMMLAKVLCWIGIVGSVMCGGALVAVGITGFGGVPAYTAILGGFAVAALGALFSWIGSFFVYGFGRLIENSDILVRNAREEI